jgi:hypothetical protein
MHRTVFTIIPLFVSALAHADGPNYQVFPQLKGLSVSSHVETRKRQTVIYATNHEKIAIICDALMTTNKQEKTKGHETLLAPGKTTRFSFQHGMYVTDVRIYLMCEPSKETDPNESPESSDEKTTERPPEKPIVVIEEDLDKM